MPLPTLAGSAPLALDKWHAEDGTERELAQYLMEVYHAHTGISRMEDGPDRPIRVSDYGAAAESSFDTYLGNVKTALGTAITNLEAIHTLAETGS